MNLQFTETDCATFQVCAVSSEVTDCGVLVCVLGITWAHPVWVDREGGIIGKI